MSAADNVKPPRPCTEYNIFFQLERAYILQVLLRIEPTYDDATDIFRPSQASYAGLPALPRRYASLVLPYDWHLPGKERRRKRKHRKSHGAIGFQDLSNRIANAWKAADAEVKAYCCQVYVVGRARYKAAVKEWKRKGGQNEVNPQKNLREVEVKAACHERSMQEPEEAKIIGNGERKEEEDLDFMALLRDLAKNDVPIPTPMISQEATSVEISRVFQNDIFLVEGEEARNIWDIQVEPLAHASKVSNETVDMDDTEIMSMWNSSDDIVINHQASYDCTPAVSPANTSKTATVYSVHKGKTGQYDSMFGLKGYAQTMQDMTRMKLILEDQVAQLQKAKRPLSLCSNVARAA